MSEQQPAPLGQEQEAADILEYIREQQDHEKWFLFGPDVLVLVTEIDRLRAALAEEQRRVQGCIQEFCEIDQVLGKALGYPWYKDDPVNFPDATEADGVCTADQTPVTLAMDAAERLKTTNHKAEYLLSLLREDADLMELLQDAILAPDPLRPDDMARIARAIEHSRE